MKQGGCQNRGIRTLAGSKRKGKKGLARTEDLLAREVVAALAARGLTLDRVRDRWDALRRDAVCRHGKHGKHEYAKLVGA